MASSYVPTQARSAVMFDVPFIVVWKLPFFCFTHFCITSVSEMSKKENVKEVHLCGVGPYYKCAASIK